MPNSNTFENSVEQLCIISHSLFNPSDPMATLQNLIHWSVTTALDPSVSASQANLYRQITERNEFLARVILPILDDVSSANLDETVLERLRHYIDESPGDTPFVYTSELDDASDLFAEEIEPGEEMLLADVAVGRKKAAARNHDKPAWRIRAELITERGKALTERRKAAGLSRRQLAEKICISVNGLQRVELGLPFIGTRTTLIRARKFLSELEKAGK